MTPSEIASLRAEALFASAVQESEAPGPARVREAVRATLRRHGTMGCALIVAQEFGEHPNEAVLRMAWVLRMLRSAYPGPTPVLLPAPRGRRRTPARAGGRRRHALGKAALLKR